MESCAVAGPKPTRFKFGYKEDNSLCRKIKKAMRADTIIGVCGVLEISADYLLFGNTPPIDFSALNSKISQLSPEQHRCLEDIINSFLTAVTPNEK